MSGDMFEELVDELAAALEPLMTCPVCGEPKHPVDIVNRPDVLVLTCSKCGLTTVSTVIPLAGLPTKDVQGVVDAAKKRRKSRASTRVF